MVEFYPLYALTNAAELYSRHYFDTPAAIPALNVNFYAQAEGILEGLTRAKSPGIIQVSRGAKKFQQGASYIRDMVLQAIEKTRCRMPIALHLDHGDEKTCLECLDSGFSSIMIDSSTRKTADGGEEKMPLEENIASTLRIVDRAHKIGASVEGEIGVLRGQEEDVESQVDIYPTAKEVLEYARQSRVDAVAVACGTCHGPVKNFKRLETKLLKDSYEMMTEGKIDGVFVLHGSSTVPKYLIEEINTYGGKLKNASGVPMDAIRTAIKYGVRKVNIDTDLRLAITAVFRKYLSDHERLESRPLEIVRDIFSGKIEVKEKDKIIDPSQIIDPRTYLQPIMNLNPVWLREDFRKSSDEAWVEVMQKVKERIANHVEMLARKFGSNDLEFAVNRNLNMTEMARRYR